MRTNTDTPVRLRLETCAAKITDWKARRAAAADRLVAVRARAEALAPHIAAAVLEGEDAKTSRKERLALLAEVEELGLAVKIADEKLGQLETQAQRAARGVEIQLALDRLRPVEELAGRVDAALPPWQDAVAAWLMAQQDAAIALGRLCPGHIFDITPGTLLGLLTWRLEGLGLNLPLAEARHRVTIRDFVEQQYSYARRRLGAELRALEEE